MGGTADPCDGRTRGGRRGLLVAAATAALALTPGTTMAAPGAPGVPSAPAVLFTEDFEHVADPAVGQSLATYTGAAPTAMTYTAHPRWLNTAECNGLIGSYNSTTGPSGCSAGVYNSYVRPIARAMGTVLGGGDDNQVMADVTSGGSAAPATPAATLQTVSSLTLPPGKRFVTFSVDAGAMACHVAHPLLRFFLMDGTTPVPMSDAAVDACTDPRGAVVDGVRVGRYASDRALLVSGGSIGVKLTNDQTNGTGNDYAVDNIRVLDATPQLDKAFSPARIPEQGTSTLTFTITNTSELAAKPGWSFTDALPTGVRVASPSAASTTCAGAAVTAAAGGTSIAVTGDLQTGQASCTVSVDVTAAEDGTYVNGPSNITPDGVDPPGVAELEVFEQTTLRVTKTASRASDYVPGGPLTYTVTVTNDGPTPARDARVADDLPSALEAFAWTCAAAAGSGCTASGTGDVDDLVTVAPGGQVTYTITGRVPHDATAPLANSATARPPAGVEDPGCSPSCADTVTLDPVDPAFEVVKEQRLRTVVGDRPDDKLTFAKQQQFAAIAPGATATIEVVCPAGSVVLDGSALVQHVDQGTGSKADVQVLRAEAAGLDRYVFEVRNPTTGTAQVQAFVTCVNATTTGGGALTVSDPVTRTLAFGAGTASATLTCGPGQLAVAPGADITGPGRLVASQPSADGRSWSFTLAADGPGSAFLSIRCLDTTTAQGASLVFADVVRQVTVPAGATASEQVTCPVGSKGITASYDLPYGLALLGSEPQPITRVFSLQNTTGAPITATLDVLCLRETTATAPPAAFTQAPIPARTGDVLEYRITVRNTGEVPLRVTDFADPRCGVPSGGLEDAAVSPGQSTTFTCSHTVTEADASAGTYANTATVTATGPGGASSAVAHASNTVVAALAAAPSPSPPAAPSPLPPAGPSTASPTAFADAPEPSALPASPSAPAPVGAAAAAPTIGTVRRRTTALQVPLTCAASCAGTVTVRLAAATRLGGRRLRAGTILGRARFARGGAVRVGIGRRTARALSTGAVRKVVVVVAAAGTSRRYTVAVR